MKNNMKLSALALAIATMGFHGITSADVGSIGIYADTDSSGGEGVFLGAQGTTTIFTNSNGTSVYTSLGISGETQIDLTLNVDGATQINNTLGVTGLITGDGGATITGATSVTGTTTINTSGSLATTIGANNNTTSINSSTVNLGTGAYTSAVTLGSTQTGTTVNAVAGNASNSLANNSAVTTVNFTGPATGSMAITSTGGASVDGNGRLTTTGATGPSASLTLTNSAGNTHGMVVTESQTTVSGGTNSSSLTLTDHNAKFSDAATGAPITVTGVADGRADFDAVNVRQFAGAIASVTAMANMPMVEHDKKFSMGIGAGSFMSKSALAVGASYRFSSNGVMRASVASGTNSGARAAIGLGAGWSW